ncbi:MAG: site-specific DNA-methyltransferase [Tessaracoccus sp.]
MPRYVMLRNPSANRVYAGESAKLSAAELRNTAAFVSDVSEETLAGIGYLGFDADPLSEAATAVVAAQSSFLALFYREGDLLRPVETADPFVLDDDLVTIPKYQGKTNEQFTRLLLNVTLAAVAREPDGRRQVLDPLAGRGTTLSAALMAGHDAYGVEADTKSFEQLASFYKTYLRRKRLKHTADVRPVRRDGKSVGRRFEATIDTSAGSLNAVVYTGDARQSAELFGKKRFDAIVTDAPYGVAHGATTDAGRDRSPAGLLRAAIPVWARQLKHGGALGISWNTFGLARDDLAAIMTKAGLNVIEDGGFQHRVDSSIKRDLIVAVAP